MELLFALFFWSKHALVVELRHDGGETVDGALDHGEILWGARGVRAVLRR